MIGLLPDDLVCDLPLTMAMTLSGAPVSGATHATKQCWNCSGPSTAQESDGFVERRTIR